MRRTRRRSPGTERGTNSGTPAKRASPSPPATSFSTVTSTSSTSTRRTPGGGTGGSTGRRAAAGAAPRRGPPSATSSRSPGRSSPRGSRRAARAAAAGLAGPGGLGGLGGLAGLAGFSGPSGLAGLAGLAGSARFVGTAGLAGTPGLAGGGGLAGRAGLGAALRWALALLRGAATLLPAAAPARRSTLLGTAALLAATAATAPRTIPPPGPRVVRHQSSPSPISTWMCPAMAGRRRSASRRSSSGRWRRDRWMSTSSSHASVGGDLRQVVDVEVLVARALVAQLVAEEGALDHQHPRRQHPRLAAEDLRAGVAAVGQGDLLPRLGDLLAGRPPARQLGPLQAAQLRPQVAAALQQVEAEAGHHVVGAEGLDRHLLAHLDAVAGGEAQQLVVVVDALQPRRRFDQRAEVVDDLGRAEDAGRLHLVQRALRQDVGHAQAVVEVAVADEQVAGARQAQRAAADVERQARRVDPQPGLDAGARHAGQPQVAETERLRLQAARSPGTASGGSAPGGATASRRRGRSATGWRRSRRAASCRPGG